MKKLFLVIVAVAVSFVSFAQQPQHKCNHSCQHQAACNQPASQQASCQQQTSCQQASKAGYTSLSVDEFAAKIQSKKVILLDVRTAKEFGEGHIKGARNVVWGNDFEAQLNKYGIRPCKTVAVYCRSGRRSKAAAEKLVSLGYTVIELDKGILGWQQAGKPVEK